MGKIIHLKKAIGVSRQLKKAGKTIVLAGGCFDLLHIGHLQFLEKAKKEGDILTIALENDANVKQIKGLNRPINSQEDRAKILASVSLINYIILLPKMEGHKDYFSLVQALKPDVIAVTKGDPYLEQKQKQARMVGGKLRVVIGHLKSSSTSQLVKILGID